MYVDNRTLFGENVDLRAAALTAGAGEYIYISDTIPLGGATNGRGASDNSFLIINCDETFVPATPPCIVTVRLVSGNDPTLVTDILSVSLNQHYNLVFSAASAVAGSRLICFPLPPRIIEYKPFLGLYCSFSGDGLSAGRWTAAIVNDPFTNYPAPDNAP